VVLLISVTVASIGDGRLESLANRLANKFDKTPVVPGTWPAVALDLTQGPVPARWSPESPVLQILPAMPRVGGSDSTTFKEIVLKEFKSFPTTIDPYCKTETPFRPGESLEVWTQRSDGQRESKHKGPSTSQIGERRRHTLSMLFHLPESFIGFKLPLIGELRPKLEGRTLRLPEGQPMTLFGLTNRDGSWLNGGLTFHRMLPDDRQPAVATLRSKHQSSFGGGDITTEWTANVASGYALELRPGGSEAKNGSVSSTTIVGKESVDFDGHSHFYSVRKGEVVFFDSAPALKQLEALAANGPLLVTNGHPRTLFAVTNALGESYSLAIELLSAKDTDP
jgi:hypothetical protein